eukprot:4970282-Amphidinium_carterae.1
MSIGRVELDYHAQNLNNLSTLCVSCACKIHEVLKESESCLPSPELAVVWRQWPELLEALHQV